MLAGDSSAGQKKQEKKGMLDQIADFFRTKVKPFLERVTKKPEKDGNAKPNERLFVFGAHSFLFEDSSELRQEAEDIIKEAGGWQAFGRRRIGDIAKHLGTIADALAFAFLGVLLGKWTLKIPRGFVCSTCHPPDDSIGRHVSLKLSAA